MSQTAIVEAALRQLGLTYETFAEMSPEALRKYWREMIKQAHPDLPQNRGRAQDPGAINAAYDVLKNAHLERARMAPAAPAGWYDRASIAPPWQPDKHAKNHKIFVESYRDQNYIKKRIWELSNRSEEIYTIDAFGKTSFEGRTRVYGNQAVFDEMAKAMLVWNANGGNPKLTRAIFVSNSKQEDALYLIYADGKSLADNPIPLKFNRNDKSFQDKLPNILDRIRDMLAGRGVAQAV
jgi:hypothetical protein